MWGRPVCPGKEAWGFPRIVLVGQVLPLHRVTLEDVASSVPVGFMGTQRGGHLGFLTAHLLSLLDLPWAGAGEKQAHLGCPLQSPHSQLVGRWGRMGCQGRGCGLLSHLDCSQRVFLWSIIPAPAPSHSCQLQSQLRHTAPQASLCRPSQGPRWGLCPSTRVRLPPRKEARLSLGWGLRTVGVTCVHARPQGCCFPSRAPTQVAAAPLPSRASSLDRSWW